MQKEKGLLCLKEGNCVCVCVRAHVCVHFLKHIVLATHCANHL